MLIFIIGFMGSGKTTIGQEVANALEIDFWDMDDVLQDQEAMSISDIFKKFGQQHFREIESKLIRSFEKVIKGDAIVSTGGGAPCFYDNIEAMNQMGTTVYLEMTPQALFERLKGEASLRPLIANKGAEEMLELIEGLLAERTPFYQKATYVVDGNRRPDTIVEHILYLLNE